MNRLKNLRCYLAGPIDHAEDDGVEWRKMMTKWLKERKVKVLDPCDKPIKNAYYREIEGEKAKIGKCRHYPALQDQSQGPNLASMGVNRPLTVLWRWV